MKQSLKSTLAIASAACMLAAFAAGCGSSPQTGSQPSAQASEDSGSTMTGNMYKEGYPIVKEQETYRMVSTFDTRQKKFNDMELFQRLEKQSNIRIEWDLIESQDFSQKKNLILASGDYPDAFFMGIGTQDLNVYVPQNVFIPLNDPIEKYAPLIQKSFEEHPDYEKICTFSDGNIYSLGNANEDPCQYNPDVLYIYKPWLDKLNLAVPTTTEEFYQVLKAFKENDPNGNGKADEIPFSAQYTAGGARGFYSLSGAFGPAAFFGPNEVASYVYEQDGKVQFSANTDSFKSFVAYVHQMFQEGLFDQEIFTQDSKQYFAKGKTEEVTLGSFILWNAENMAGSERAAEYIPVTPLKGPDGHQSWINNKRSNGSISNSTFAITSKCKTPEVLVRWVDQFYDKKTGVEACWGPIEEGDGMYKFPALAEGETFDARRYQECPVWPPSCVYATDYDTFVEMPPMMVEKNKIREELYLPYQTTNTLPLIAFTQEETNWNTTTGNDIITYVNDTMARWMMQGGIDGEWDGYLKQLDTLNVEKHLEVLQGAYDRTMK